MKKLFRHIQSGNFTTLGFTSGTPYEDQEAFPPVRVMPTMFEAWVVENGEVDLDKARRELEVRLPMPHDMIMLDVESMPLFRGKNSWFTDPADWQQFVDTVGPILEVLRSVDGDLKWSLFGACPSVVCRHINAFMANRVGPCLYHKDGPQEARYREWLNAVTQLKFQAEHLAPLLDWYVVPLYPGFWHSKYAFDCIEDWYFWDDHTQVIGDVMAPFAAQTTEWDVMRDCTNVLMSVAKQILPDKPFVSLLAAQWFGEQNQPWQQHEQGEFVSAEWMRKSLSQARVTADSVAIWSEPERVMMSPEKYYASPLWRLIHRWAAHQAGR